MIAEAREPDSDGSELPRRDLREAVEVALARDGSLLSAGEGVVARAWLALPDPVASLYARLFGRKPRVFFLESLAYAEIPDLPAAAAALCAAGFAEDAAARAPAALLAEALTVPELKAAAMALGRPTRGLRPALVAALSDAAARPALARPGIWLRHRGLFRRLARLYFHDHEGDLSRIVVARMGVVKAAIYAPTGGAGLFPCRRELLAYEAALATRADPEAWTEEAVLGDLPRLTANLRASTLPPAERARFSARRFEEERALAAARHLERLGRVEEAEAAYRQLRAAGLRAEDDAALRHAMCLDGLGRQAEAAALCAAARALATPTAALALDRTGRRLARSSGTPWIPRIPLQAAPARQVPLASDGRVGPRPGWAARAGAVPVEQALVDSLQQLGRPAIFAENELWTTLFALLLDEVMWAPVPGMLPTPLLRGPLDLGTRAFAPRRAALLDAALDQISAGGATRRLVGTWTSRHGEAISGLRWDRFSREALLSVVDAVGGPALAAILRAMAEEGREAGRGLPDLVVLPGDPLQLPGALPSLVPPGLLLAEVKGPGDTLRDGQRLWLDRLLGLGLRVELWNVVPARAQALSPADPSG